MSHIESFYDDIHQHFSSAKEENDDLSKTISINSLEITLVFTNRTVLEAILPALAHNIVHSKRVPGLIINIWDSVSTDSPFISFPWNAEDIRERGVIRGYNNDRFISVFAHGSSGIQLLDLENSVGYFWVYDINELPYYEKAAPLRNILHWWLRQFGLVLTHGGSACYKSAGAVFIGQGGRGKSTTAISCLLSEMEFISDDYCFISGTEKRVYSIFNSAKLNTGSLTSGSYLYSILGGIVPLNGDKDVYLLHEEPGISIAHEAKVKCLFSLRFTQDEHPYVEKISKIEALSELAPSSIYQVATAGTFEFRVFSELVKGVDLFQLYLCKDLRTNSIFIKTLISNYDDDSC